MAKPGDDEALSALLSGQVERINQAVAKRLEEPRASLVRLLETFGEGDDGEAAKIIAEAARKLFKVRGDLAGTFGAFSLFILDAYARGDLEKLYQDDGPADWFMRRSGAVTDPRVATERGRALVQNMTDFLLEGVDQRNGRENAIKLAIGKLEALGAAFNLATWTMMRLLADEAYLPGSPLFPWNRKLDGDALARALFDAAEEISRAARDRRANPKTIATAALVGLGLDKERARAAMRHVRTG